jgi:hypothetical protein
MRKAARRWCVAFIGECTRLVALSRRRRCMDRSSQGCCTCEDMARDIGGPGSNEKEDNLGVAGA